MCGFQTASGKAVAVSAEGLKAVRLMFEKEFSQNPVPNIPAFEPDSTDGIATSLRTNANLQPASEKPLQDPVGFTSAKGTAIRVSAEALEKARRLFQEELATKEETPDQKTEAEVRPELKISTGFCTATGKNVAVSEEHLNAVRQLLQEGANSPPATGSPPGKSTAVELKPVSGAETLSRKRSLLEIPENVGQKPAKPSVRRIAGE